jgi:GntR family transcriptional regulator
MSSSVTRMGRDLRYLTVAAELRAGLGSDAYPPGQLLPSEAELAATHDVSRVTIRKALGQLKGEGLVDSRQGFGWYAVAPPLRQSLSELTTIEDQIAAAGLRSERRILSFAFIPAPDRPARVLDVATVLEFTRLNLADDRPFARVTVWVPDTLAADLSRRAVEEHPLHALLDITLGGATQTITAIGASRADASLLRLSEGSPLLHCERTTRDGSGRPVLLSDAVFNPLVTEFVADLPAHHQIEPAGLRLVQ